MSCLSPAQVHDVFSGCMLSSERTWGLTQMLVLPSKLINLTGYLSFGLCGLFSCFVLFFWKGPYTTSLWSFFFQTIFFFARWRETERPLYKEMWSARFVFSSYGSHCSYELLFCLLCSLVSSTRVLICLSICKSVSWNMSCYAELIFFILYRNLCLSLKGRTEVNGIGIYPDFNLQVQV